MSKLRIDPDKVSHVFKTDSYKPSHWKQYPPGTEAYFGYIEARKPLKSIEPFHETVWVGLQIFLKRYLSKPFLGFDEIDMAEKFFEMHGEPFNREGWEYILDKYGGYIPVTIKAVPEGSVIPEGNVLCTIECNDSKCFWIASYIETVLVRAAWYGSTVATISRECKKFISKYMNLSSDNPGAGMPFKLHDFGSRGVSSGESASIGGVGHLANFQGSDNIESILYANWYYDCDMAGFSIPAAEHSTITSWGEENEAEAYRNMLRVFGKPGKIFACVSDSYDIFNACENIWGTELRQELIDSGATVVIRPDSGIPHVTVLKCLDILADKFGYVVNNKGYKVLNPCVRIIQGDGINLYTIKDICRVVTQHGYSMDNVSLGMGGALLQHLDRDTLRFAMKLSATMRDGKWYDAFKNPVGDPMKRSKAGRISLYRRRNGHGTSYEYVTMRIDEAEHIKQKYTLFEECRGCIEEALNIVYVNGKLFNETTLDEVRQRASL